MQIRKAIINDVHSMHMLLNYYAEKDFLLPRSLSALYDHLRDYFVLVDEAQGNLIKGVCGLGICWEDLAEIRSLAVTEDQHGNGSGSRLVETCLKEAGTLGLKKVFVLTYVPTFFEKLGFKEVEKSTLPHKIWADCLQCPKFPDCDETALMFNL